MGELAKPFVKGPATRILEQCLNLQSGETLLVLTDSLTVEFGKPFVLVGRAMGADVTFLEMAPRSRHGEELPGPVSGAMKGADAIVAPTTYSVNHTQARFEASAAGARLIFMPDVCDEIFLDGSLDIDFLEQKKVIDRIADVLDKGSSMRVRSPQGTDLRVDIAGKKSVPQSGICHEPGSISPPPCIEVAVAPDEGTAEGLLVVDGATVPGGVCKEPIEIQFAEGRIVSIKGGEEAHRLTELLESYDDPNIYWAVEMGMGMNPKAQIGRGGPLENEAEFGTLHVGIGNGITFGSSIRASGHCDLVMRDAFVEVNGTTILKDKKLHI